MKSSHPELLVETLVFQDHGKGGLSLRGVAVTTETATTAETAKTVKTVRAASWYCILWEKQKEGKVLSRTAKTAKTVMKATPLKLNPPFSVILSFATQARQGAPSYHPATNDDLPIQVSGL